MKTAAFVFTLFIIIWLSMLTFVMGGEHTTLLQALAALKPPETTSDLGESMAILDGLLSSLAVALGLVAVMLQRKDLQSSIQAQCEQVKMLSAQMREQQESNHLAACTARLQFLLSESERLSSDIERLIKDVNNTHNPEKKKILENCIGKRKTYREEAQKIDTTISEIMKTTRTYTTSYRLQKKQQHNK